MSKDGASPEKRKFWPVITRSSSGIDRGGGRDEVDVQQVVSSSVSASRHRYLDLFHLPFGRSRSPTPGPSSATSDSNVAFTVPTPYVSFYQMLALFLPITSDLQRRSRSTSLRVINEREDVKRSVMKTDKGSTSRDSDDMFDTLRVDANNRLGDMQTSKIPDLLRPLKTFSSVAESIAELNPYAQLALGILVSASDAILNQKKRDDDIESLFSKLSDVYLLLTMRREQAADRSMERVLVELAQNVRVCVDFIVRYTEDKSYWLRLFKNVGKDTDAVIGEYNAALEGHMQRFRDRNALQTTLFVYRIAEDVYLNDMESATRVSFNTSKQCLEGTRMNILSEIKDWARNTADDAEPTMWLSGMAGKGKSAIAHTIASWAEACGILGSCFCFDRTREGDRLHQKIFTTIARDLADHDPLIRRALTDVIRDSNELRHTPDMQRQWVKLLLGPMRAASKVVRAPVLIVIDALDESGERDIRKEILRALSGRWDKSSLPATALPPTVRILITSRPLPDIKDALEAAPHVRHRSLDDVPREDSEHDVRCYITDELRSPTRFNEIHFRTLAQKADGVFEWARLACWYIMNDTLAGLDATERFDSIMAGTSATGTTLLDDMYKLVLQGAMPQTQHQDVIPLFRSVMGQIICSSEPLPMAALIAMRQHFSCEDKIKVEPIIKSLSALLTGTTGGSDPVRPLHASFYDFLTDRKRSGEFYIETSRVQHHRLAFACLRVMKTELRFNICNLKNSYLPNSSVIDLPQRIERCISPQLNYSCRFWTSHLLASPFESSLVQEIKLFFEERVLFWLEVLSLTNSLSGAALAMFLISSRLAGDPTYAQVRTAATDTERFVRMFSATMLRSTPHLYLSALPFAPTQSHIFQTSRYKFPQTLTVTTAGMDTWPSVEKIIHGHTGAVTSVTLSHDSRCIVSGSMDGTIRVWDAEIGAQLLPTLEGHTNEVWSVAVSLDGRRIVSGSKDKTVRIWDRETGSQLLPALKGHTDEVWSVAVSSDGRRVVSGSKDETIRVWDGEIGVQLLPALEGHTDCISSVAISPDGQRIVSGSCDKTIRVWDGVTGVQLLPALEGHMDSIISVAVSPNKQYIVSGSDDNTVCVWNGETGAQLFPALKGHTDSVWTVAISPDGRRIVLDHETAQSVVWSVAVSPDSRRIVSGSGDNTIRVWDAQTGPQLFSALDEHRDSLVSVAVSPDGRRIVSGSRGNTIRVWDRETGVQLLPALKGHTNGIWSVAVSSDGRRIASGSRDKTIRLWNAETGAQLLPALEGHTESVWSVAISHDGRYIVSGSDDKTIRVWDGETGVQLLPALEGHTECVCCVVISPDGRCIVSGSDDKTIRIWDIQTGVQLLPALKGHTRNICCVAISPDGRRIVSGSEDRTIRVWDARTGVQLLPALEGHTDEVWSVAVSPDGRLIVSGSKDKTIRVWDGETGAQLFPTLEGHTDSIISVAISYDSQCIVSGSRDNTIRVWNAATGAHFLPASERHTEDMSAKGSPRDRRMVPESTHDIMRLRRTDSGGFHDSILCVVM
ncbi:uncharacterized protein FIBRA_08363 [Fibroporia radiculosa]|uniref:Nephrocystin 3-like N-terminal domain-containing protein n=1 Tax=Fibroporia radiculosa TaxID=599839 RepID=J4H548_9APHY|nr:uncharacterized protein FIBRA_08363 [Fibroporia radiculosa]CCM06114.1 predicted protein [Fibroporia radiculosa]